MKNILLTLILFAVSFNLPAISNPPYIMHLSLLEDPDAFASFPTTYTIISKSAVDSSLELDSNSIGGLAKNPYYIEENKTYYLELRDSTNKVIWSREMIREHSRSDSTENDYRTLDDNPEPTLVQGICLEKDGTILLADKDNQRYYLLDKNGKRTDMPFQTLGMFSGGWVADKYWLLAHGTGIQNYSYYDAQSEEDGMDPLYTSYVTLYNRDGTLYRFLDLSDWGEPKNFWIDPTTTYCWFTWSRQVTINPTSGMRDEDQNNPEFWDQHPGMTIMRLDGKIMYSGVIPEFRKGDYINNFNWSINGELIYFFYGNCFRIFDTSDGTLYAKMEAQSPDGYYYGSIVALSSKKTGLAFVTVHSSLIVYDYIHEKVVAVIPDLEYESLVHLEKPDGSDFSILHGDFKTTYRLNKK